MNQIYKNRKLTIIIFLVSKPTEGGLFHFFPLSLTNSDDKFENYRHQQFMQTHPFYHILKEIKFSLPKIDSSLLNFHQMNADIYIRKSMIRERVIDIFSQQRKR